MVDATDLKSVVLGACGFDSHPRYNHDVGHSYNDPAFFKNLIASGLKVKGHPGKENLKSHSRMALTANIWVYISW